MGSLEHLATTALGHIDREFPHKTGLIWSDSPDVVRPRRAHPVFFGSFDWHSAVHSHWTLVRLLRLGVQTEAIAAALDARLLPDKLELERETIARDDRRGFEMPYGVAWLLALAAELTELASEHPERGAWFSAIDPLARLAAQRLGDWLERLPVPIRSGEHTQTAWSMTLALEAAGPLGDDELAALIEKRARDFYQRDVDAPIAYEPSAYDFLSPVLGEAELMASVLGAAEFRSWWRSFAGGARFAPVETVDRTDGKLAHADGLNLSRAWMLAAVAATLEPGDERERLEAMAREHLDAGEAGRERASYAGTHWLATFSLRARLKVGGEST